MRISDWSSDVCSSDLKADGNITAVNEFDFFFGVSANVTPKLNVGVEYSQFISGQPSVAFKNAHNIEFSAKYSDNPGGDFAINPYRPEEHTSELPSLIRI